MDCLNNKNKGTNKPKEEEKQPAYKPYQVPIYLYNLLEEEAIKRRKETGENIIWSTILREILWNYFEKSQQKACFSFKAPYN